MGENFLERLFRRRPADIRVRPGAQTLGHLGAHLDTALAGRMAQCLCVRIGDDKLDTLQAAMYHVIDRISAGAPDADNRNARLQLRRVAHRRYCEINRHLDLQTSL